MNGKEKYHNFTSFIAATLFNVLASELLISSYSISLEHKNSMKVKRSQMKILFPSHFHHQYCNFFSPHSLYGCTDSFNIRVSEFLNLRGLSTSFVRAYLFVIYMLIELWEWNVEWMWQIGIFQLFEEGRKRKLNGKKAVALKLSCCDSFVPFLQLKKLEKWKFSENDCDAGGFH
jgi:hypothetical protein